MTLIDATDQGNKDSGMGLASQPQPEDPATGSSASTPAQAVTIGQAPSLTTPPCVFAPTTVQPNPPEYTMSRSTDGTTVILEGRNDERMFVLLGVRRT